MKAGVLMALFVSLPSALHFHAMVQSSAAGQFLPAVWITVVWGIAGIVIGAVYGRKALIDGGSVNNSADLH